jgi:nucleotide-binding universal stress UspA family protein
LSETDSPIVVGIDFSDGSAFALAGARLLARRMQQPLQLIHVLEQEPSDPAARHSSWLRQCGIEMKNVITRAEGTPWTEIARFALQVNATLIVVGSHGRSGYQPLLPGSTTARLITRSTVPVLVVPGPSSSRYFQPRLREHSNS